MWYKLDLPGPPEGVEGRGRLFGAGIKVVGWLVAVGKVGRSCVAVPGMAGRNGLAEPGVEVPCAESDVTGRAWLKFTPEC